MQQGIFADQKNHPLLGNLISKIEEIFFFLISAAEKHLDEEKIDRIIESPDHSGQTVFMDASFLSEKISGWILDRNIDVAFVHETWMTPQFWFESNVEKMLKKGINPFVVNYTGESEYDLRNFENIDQKLLEPFISGKISKQRTEVFYSFEDSECSEKCKNSCEDKMLKFKLYTGKRNFKNEKIGGEAVVSFGTWHGEPVAFKLLELGKIEEVDWADEAISKAEKTRAEFLTTSKLDHQTILRVLHVFRYQETKKFRNTLSLQNWTVIVMEKHEKNIGELTTEERIHLPDLLQDVIGKSSIFVSIFLSSIEFFLMNKYFHTAKYKLLRCDHIHRESRPHSRRHQTWEYFGFKARRSPEGIRGRFWTNWKIWGNPDLYGA